MLLFEYFKTRFLLRSDHPDDKAVPAGESDLYLSLSLLYVNQDPNGKQNGALSGSMKLTQRHSGCQIARRH